MIIAILGAGQIAHKMAATITKMEMVEAYAIAARDAKRAQSFAEQYGFTKAYGSYEEMLSDKEVDLVYIATPHSHHYEHIRLCLAHQKHVLCEKSFTVNARQAREVLQMAEEKGLLLTEAIWTRYMPSRKMVNDIIDSGVIGADYTPPEQITGYEYEVEACRRAIQEGRTQCSEMPHEETIRVLEIMDDMRRSWGYQIPGEN